MRAIKSYGTAAVVIILIAMWFSTGLFVEGGNGPDASERSVTSILEEDGGPITDAVAATGIAREVHHEEGVNDPSLSIAQRNALTAQEEGVLRIVRVETFTIQPMKLEVTLRGHTQAKASLSVSAQASEIVDTVAVSEGQRVAQGDLICTLKSGVRQASVNQAQAAVKQAEAGLLRAQTDFQTNLALREKGLASKNSAESFLANLRSAESGLEAAQVALSNREADLGKTEIRAGMAGVIQGPIVESGALLNFGQPCAAIIQLDPMLFIGAIPQAKINYVKTGMSATIRTINEQTAEGKVTFVAVSSNPATRTFAMEIEFANPEMLVFDGLTAEALVNMGSIPAHLLPQSVLTLDSDGALGVKVVEDGLVVFYPLQILGDSREGVWVSGLPPKVDAIVLGQEYVSDGQKVDARFAE